MVYMLSRQQYSSRETAARAAHANGNAAFETVISDVSQEMWKYAIRIEGPGIEYARIFAEGKDWVHHVEVTEAGLGVLIVTCLKEEIPEVIPNVLRVRPITPSLWKLTNREYVRAMESDTVLKGAPRVVKSKSLAPAHEQAALDAQNKATKVPGDRNDTRQKHYSSSCENPVKVMADLYTECKGDKAAILLAAEKLGVGKSTAIAQYYRNKKKALDTQQTD